jgi:hypothetical protein
MDRDTRPVPGALRSCTEGNDTMNDFSPESIGWQWDAAAGGGRAARTTLEAEDGGRFVFAHILDGDVIELQRLRSTGVAVWTRRVPAFGANSAVLLHRAGKLYAALYNDIGTGCRVLAQDAVSGDVLWEAPLKGLGPLHHSKYSNLVQMRFIDDRLVVFGNESGGKYLEVLDPNSGRITFRKPM